LNHSIQTIVKHFFLIFLVASYCHAHADTPKTCADVQWIPDTISQYQRVNTPGANTSSDTNSKAIAIDLKAKIHEANKVATYLRCDIGLLTPLTKLGAQPPNEKNDFESKILNSLKEGRLDKKIIAQAIYLQSLINNNKRLTGYNSQTANWKIIQAKQWCEENDKTTDGSIVLPQTLPTMEMGIGNIEPVAISFSWQVISTYSSAQLGKDCSTTVREFASGVNTSH
jgi:hypothetical protein